MDVVALGCGDAKRETKLVEYLLQHIKKRSIKNIFALHGNFHQLSQYPLFSSGDKRTRCRVFTLLGNTLANLDNEIRFFRDTMNAAEPGDFFVADYTQAYASPGDPERIRELDPPFRAGVRMAHKTWLEGPIQRYTKGARAIDLSIELTTDCLVRGSYEIAYVAKVTMEKGLTKRRFVVLRIRRYESASLSNYLARTGWATELNLPYGSGERDTLRLLLLRKTL